jgi:hypothetical protein
MEMAGHNDLETTKKYYLSVDEEDMAKVRQSMSAMLSGLELKPTDPKVTHSARKREFPQRKVSSNNSQPPEV